MLSWCWESRRRDKALGLGRTPAQRDREQPRRRWCEAVTANTRGACVVLGRGERRGHSACNRRQNINAGRKVVKKNVIASVKILSVYPSILPKRESRRFGRAGPENREA